jgi:RNA polymerase sigma factor (sigma-70 family)
VSDPALAGDASAGTSLVEDLFRREAAHLVASLARLFGPSNLALIEDVVQDALLAAMQAWQFGLPRDPKAWILQAAKNRAIDVVRRDRRLVSLPAELDAESDLAGAVASALSPAEDGANQLAMMYSICDESLSQETHVTLILRLLCGLGPAEIARAFLLDTQTIDRRLHRGRARLATLGRLHDVNDPSQVRERQPSVLQALYLLFSEGYHGSDAENPVHPAMCADAIRLTELLIDGRATDHVEAHALASLFCLNAARLPARLDDAGVFVALAEQDRTRWDRSLIDRGVVHLAAAATGERLGRWHLEAGIACEHAIAPSIEATDWPRIVDLYDQLLAVAPGPIVALNRALALAELRGPDAGREALVAIADDDRLSRYPFFWGARADVERRAGRPAEARPFYERALAVSRNRAERESYQRRLAGLVT